MTELELKYNMLDEESKKQLMDFIDFLLSTKKKVAEPPEYYQRIQTVSKWSEEDVAYLKEINDKFNWKVEEW